MLLTVGIVIVLVWVVWLVVQVRTAPYEHELWPGGAEGFRAAGEEDAPVGQADRRLAEEQVFRLGGARLRTVQDVVKPPLGCARARLQQFSGGAPEA
jgi:hypothetical protein